MTHVPSAWMRPKITKQTGGSFNIGRIKEKAPFMGSVIVLVFIQLLITFFIMEKLAKNEKIQTTLSQNKAYLITLFVLPLVIILVLAFVPMPMYIKLILFTIFSILFGILLSVVRHLISPELVRVAVIATLGIFVSMFIVGIILAGLGYDLFWLGMILFILLLALVIAGIVMLFISPDKKTLRIRAFFVILLFAVYIIYDTNQIIMRDYDNDYVTAGLDYYLDFVNVFVALIELISNSN